MRWGPQDATATGPQPSKASLAARTAKPLLGLLLLGGLLSVVDADRVAQALRHADASIFGLGLLAALLANALSVLRWQRIARGLGMPAPYRGLLRIYLQGIAINSLLPGGIVGGDLYRSVRLQALVPGAGFARAGFAVLAERASGLWGLGAVSLLAMLVMLGLPGLPGQPSPSMGQPMQWYGMAVLALALGPAAAMLLLAWRPGLAQALPGKLAALASALPQLLPTLPLSMLMQAATIAAFGLCLHSVGVPIEGAHGVLLLAMLCSGIFLAAVLPASVGGFGAREASTLFFFTLAGTTTQPELLLAGSVLFGITATLQGLVGAVLFALPGTPNTQTD